MVAQGANQAVLRAGDMAVYDSTRPYTVLNTTRTELHYFQVPRSALGLPDGTIDAVAGLRIGPDNNALAAVVAPYFDRLGSTDVLDHPTAAALVAGPSIDLLRALITTHVADEPRAVAPLQGSLVLRVQEYVGPTWRTGTCPRRPSPRRTTCPSGTCTRSWSAPASGCRTPSGPCGCRSADERCATPRPRT